MATQWPLIAAKLVAKLPTLSGWDQVMVFDGPSTSGDTPLQYATVGYVADPNLADSAGTYTSTQADDGFRRVETGQVLGEIVAVTGDDDIPGVRAQAFALADAFDAWVRGSRTLDATLSPEGFCDMTFDVSLSTNVQSCKAGLRWSLSYTTVT